LILNAEHRENIRSLMAEEERKGHVMTEDEMRSQMNATSGNMLRYMKAYNLWIIKSNYYRYLEKMNRFKSFTEYKESFEV
jgi:hypothetical protein